MKRLLILGLLVSCGFLIRQASGQIEKTEMPAPKIPLLPRAPEFASWTIVEKADTPKTSPEAVDTDSKGRRTIITKTGANYREVSTDPARGETTKWVLEGFQIKQEPGARLIRIPRTKYSSEFSDYLRSDFESFEWINRENYKGVQKFENRLCYVFEVGSGKRRLTPRERHDKLQVLSDTEKLPDETETTTEPSHTLTAYLDIATQLPVALKVGERLTTYTFNAPPTAPLSPPADVLESLTKWREAIQSRNRPPPRP